MVEYNPCPAQLDSCCLTAASQLLIDYQPNLCQSPHSNVLCGQNRGAAQCLKDHQHFVDTFYLRELYKHQSHANKIFTQWTSQQGQFYEAAAFVYTILQIGSQLTMCINCFHFVFFCRNNRHWVDSDLKEAAAGAYLSVPNPQNRGAHIFISHQHSTPPSLWEFIRFQNLPKVFFKVLGFLRCQVDSVRLTLSGSPKLMKEKNRLQQHHCSRKAECQVHKTYIIHLYKERWKPKWKTKKELLLKLIKSMTKVKYQVNGGDSDAIIWRWWLRPAPGFHYGDFNYRHQAENGQKNEKDIKPKL